MIFRIAKPSDLKQILNLHFKVRETYSIGYFSLMGKAFIKEYYRTILNDPYEMVICAEDSDGKIRGFCSATLNIKKQFERMRKRKWRFALAAIPSFIKRPDLIKKTLERYKATKGDKSEKYIPEKGPRGEYWTWDLEYKDGLSNAALYSCHLKILYALGVKTLPFEVDEVNDKVLKFVLKNKAKKISEVELLDGRKRMLLEYDLYQKYRK